MESTGFQVMFGALREINSDIPELQSDIASLENPEFFKNEMSLAGFRDIETHRVIGEIPFTNVEQFWDEMTRGSAPIMVFKNNLSEKDWSEKTQIALSYLRKKQVELGDILQIYTWLAVGTK